MFYNVFCTCIESRVGNWCTLEGEQHAVWITLFKTGRFLWCYNADALSTIGSTGNTDFWGTNNNVETN